LFNPAAYAARLADFSGITFLTGNKQLYVAIDGDISVNAHHFYRSSVPIASNCRPSNELTKNGGFAFHEGKRETADVE